jgi:hypothetical protein
MTTFDERERAAENLFAHDQQRQFLARRRGIEVAAAWAAETMGLGPDERSRYVQSFVDAFILGGMEDRLILTMQTDLERAGKPAFSGQVGLILSRAAAEAALDQRGQPDLMRDGPADPRAEWERHHPRPVHHWAWGL